MTDELRYEDVTPAGHEILKRVRLAPKGRFVVDSEGEALDEAGLDGLETSLANRLERESVRNGVYGFVVKSSRITEDDVRDRVSNVIKRPLVCLWGIVADESTKTFFACHTLFRSPTSPTFESECRELVATGYEGRGERKRYAAWLDFIVVRLNPMIRMSAYDAERVVDRLVEEAKQ